MADDLIDTNGFYTKQMELLIVIALIAFLASLAIQAYLPLLTRAKLVHASSMDPSRLNAHYYYAVHGQWPRDNDQAKNFGWNRHIDLEPNAYLKETIIENGAIHQIFGAELPGRVMTIRPATPADDLLGPIIWVCGNYRQPKEWHVFGEDRTNIDPRHIHPYLK